MQLFEALRCLFFISFLLFFPFCIFTHHLHTRALISSILFLTQQPLPVSHLEAMQRAYDLNKIQNSEIRFRSVVPRTVQFQLRCSSSFGFFLFLIFLKNKYHTGSGVFLIVAYPFLVILFVTDRNNLRSEMVYRRW